MAQPSVASFFHTRKRSAVEDVKINRAKKVLLLDSSTTLKDGLETDRRTIFLSESKKDDLVLIEKKSELQNKEEKHVLGNKINTGNIAMISKSEVKKTSHITRMKKMKEVSNNGNIQELFNNINKKRSSVNIDSLDLISTDTSDKIKDVEKHVTPPNTPKCTVNAMDKVKEKSDELSIKEIKRKMTRSARLAELKASISRFQQGDVKLKEIEKKTSRCSESPKLKNFKTIELEVETSPQKVYSPEKAYLSPKKESSARRNLIHLFSPTKNAVAVHPASPSKLIVEKSSKPALTLPYKYRYLAELFRCIDTICQMLFNRKQSITFNNLKPAVEEMLKRNLLQKHLSQIQYIYPEAFKFHWEKQRVIGAGGKQEQWELVITPDIGDVEHMNSDKLLERRRKLFNILLDRVKNYHHEFLMSLDPPMVIAKDKITRWHPEFDIERLPDIELAKLPQAPTEEKITSGKEVLEKARQMFNCNTKMEQALQRLQQSREANTQTKEENHKEVPTSVLKGIPKALLEKVRQKQLAKALVSMTRSADKEKELLMYSRLPEIARLARNLYVTEKKGVLPLDTVIEKLGNCYRTHLTKTEMEEHLKLISKEVPTWLIFHDIRNCIYLKLNKNDDLSIILNKLENLAKQKSES